MHAYAHTQPNTKFYLKKDRKKTIHTHRENKKVKYETMKIAGDAL